MLGQISVSMNTVLKFLFINYKIYIQFIFNFFTIFHNITVFTVFC